MKKHATPFNHHPVAVPRKNRAELKRNEIEVAVQEFLSRGGTIERIQSHDTEVTPRKVNVSSRWAGPAGEVDAVSEELY